MDGELAFYNFLIHDCGELFPLFHSHEKGKTTFIAFSFFKDAE